MSEEVVEPPVGLGLRGSAFWRELHEALEFEPKESALVLEACRVLDVIDELVGVLERDGSMTKGSAGQPVVHPVVAEIRQQQQTFGRLMGLVRLPEDEQAADRFRTARAKAGAAARWQSPGLRAVR